MMLVADTSSAATMTMGDMGTVGVSKVGGFNVNGAYDETYQELTRKTLMLVDSLH